MPVAAGVQRICVPDQEICGRRDRDRGGRRQDGNECIAEGILADFLRSQRAEVVAVSIFEYNEEEELKKLGRAE